MIHCDSGGSSGDTEQQSDTGRDYSLGWSLVRGSGFGSGSFALSLEAQRRETANHDIAPEHQVGFRIDARF